MIQYQREQWDRFCPDAMELFKEHNNEVGEDNEEFDPDYEATGKACEKGVLVVFTARKNNKLVGYLWFGVSRHLVNKKTICATQCLFFVTASERQGRVGIGLYKYAIEELKKMGVTKLYPHHFLRSDSARLGEFFKRLGAVELQHEYSLKIGD